MEKNLLKEISPLHGYWNSEQNDNDEKNRLLKLNKLSKAAYLYEKEPYKWEILFQSILRELIKGDEDSIKGLKVILDCLNKEEKETVISKLEKFEELSSTTIKQIREPIDYKSKTKKNIFRFFRILISIFFNPYRLELKGEKKHLYERTGYLVNKLRS